MQKNKSKFIYSVMLIILLISIFLPFAASAYDMPTGMPVVMKPGNVNGMVINHICPGPDINNPDDGLVSRIVPCVRDSVIFATSVLMDVMVRMTIDNVKILIAIGIAAFGIAMVTGKTPSVSQSGLILIIKIGAIMLFLNQFGGLYPLILNALENLLDIMAKPAILAFAEGGPWNHIANTGTASFTCKFGTFQASETNIMRVWNLIDCYINLIVGGVFSGANLMVGIIGFVMAAVFSTTLGFFIAFAGLYLLATAFITILRTVYIFLTSYVAFSFMVIISSIFIPLILFQSTKHYFDSWLRLTISFILQPVFVFGYLIMFLVAFNTVIFSGKHSLYYAIVGQESQQTNFHIGTWLQANGIYKEDLQSKDNASLGGSGSQLDAQMVQTQIQGKQGHRSPTAPPLEELLGSLSNLSVDFFEMGIPVKVIHWQKLAQAAKGVEWNAAIGALSDGPDKDKAIEKFVLDYKISLLIAFLMAAIFIYIFYSLIEYLPFIGTATMGDGGVVPLGVGSLTPTGSHLLGGAR